MKRRKFLKMLSAAGITAGGTTAGACAFMSGEQFGQLPEGAGLARITSSPNWDGTQFRYPPAYHVEKHASSIPGTWAHFLFARRHRTKPDMPVPSVRADLKHLPGERDMVVWFGHSSFLLRLSGRIILADPVFSGRASPVPMTVQAFPGSIECTPDELPGIDCILISHDHWDHLDHDTVRALAPHTKRFVTTLGCGSHLRAWGIPSGSIDELDWWDETEPVPGLHFHATPGRHFSGRGFARNRTLWAGFVIDSPGKRIYYSGDGSYGPHFADIGSRMPGISLALMECGQYDKAWPDVHMMPEQTAQAAVDVGARALLPLHAGKFALALHPWDEPYRRLEAAMRNSAVRLLTPPPGLPLDIDLALAPVFQGTPRWWNPPSGHE